MPLYEYHCPQCGYRYEKIQKFSAEPETVCPKCGGVLQRPLTAPALQFKGAGWYVNDYAPKGSASSSEKPAGDATASPSGDAKPSTESKPAATESASKPAAASSTAGSASSTS